MHRQNMSGKTSERGGRSGLRANAAAVPRAALLATLLLLLTTCTTGPETGSFAGTWTGYLSIGEDISGSTTLTVSGDRSCVLDAEISGNRTGWGDYTLRLEGEPTIDSRSVSGPITVTRYRAGVDTVQTTGFWSGHFYVENNSAAGGWTTYTTSAFLVEGNWGVSKK